MPMELLKFNFKYLCADNAFVVFRKWNHKTIPKEKLEIIFQPFLYSAHSIFHFSFSFFNFFDFIEELFP